ncbi:MAG: ATP-binding protein [Bdellovibrio sp.]|nr:ATP-binding protein [Bdellovibrio sp.]
MSRKIAITGGPSGGKTTLIDALKQTFGSKVKVVPEAASILYKGGFPRAKDYNGYYHAQKAIFATQRELEELRTKTHPDALIVCDRGSLDSLAYWPDTEEHFYKTLNTDRKTEIARYDWVIHLDTATETDYDTSNDIRTENFHEALLLNEKIKKSWEGHPQRVVITAENDFVSKMKKATAVIDAILNQKTYEDITLIK